MNTTPDPALYAGPVWVTLAYLAIYYVFISNILRTKLGLAKKYWEEGKKFDRYFGQDRQMLAADRTQLNMLEHMPVFLVLLWLHAWVVGPLEATVLGGVYTGTRALYPLVLGGRLGRMVPSRIMVITFTGYGVLAALAVRIAMSL
jgi:hypothetical protein